MKKEDFLKSLLNEEGEATSTASVLGDPGSPTYGGFIGPLGRISKKKLNSRLFHTWKDSSVKNGVGVGRIAIPPQGYVKEHIYSTEGALVTEGDLLEWFGGDLKQKPAYNGGQLVAIEPKCLAFPYCSQGAIDKPIKLIGESKEEMCEGCYGYCSHIAEETGKSPEFVAKLIREKYLAETIDMVKMENINESVIEQLNESIELLDENYTEENKNLENTNTMENIQLTPQFASECMSGIMENNQLAECMYETLIHEGFLPETLNEGETYESHCKAMMEDAEICMEMVKSCMMNEGSSCANEVSNYISECWGNKGSMASEQPMYEDAYYAGVDPEEGGIYLEEDGEIVDEADDTNKYAKIEASVQNNGARETAVKLVNMFIGRMLGGMSSSDLADTATFANGLDTIEEFLEDGDYEGAVIEAKETAQAMLEDEGMGMDMFDEGKMDEAEGISQLIYKQLKHCIEHGHSYDQSKEHVDKAVEGGWDLSMEDYLEAKEKFGKGKRDGVELEEDWMNEMDLEEGGDDSSRYMFFSNLEQIKRQADVLMKFDHGKIEAILNSGHDWAADHMAVTKENLSHVFDFLMNEMEGDNAPEGDMTPAPLDMAPVGPIGVEGPADELMEYNDETDVDDEDVAVSDQYEREMKYFTNFMNAIEKSMGTVAKGLSSDEIKGKFNQYYSQFESSRDANADQFINFIQKTPEESYLEYCDRLFEKGPNNSILNLLVSPTKRSFLEKTGLLMDDDLTDALDTVDELQPRAMKKAEFIRAYTEKQDSKYKDTEDDDFSDEKEPSMGDLKSIEKMGNFDVDNGDDDFLEEAELAKFVATKGKNVDSENAKNEKEAKDMIKDAEKTQKTVDQKVDNLKNQKHTNSDWEESIATKQHGRNSMLDLDYVNDSGEDFKDKIENQANGLPDKPGEANVDYESKGGEKLMQAVKDRRDVRDMDYTSKGLNINKDDSYERSDALPGDDDKKKKDKKVNEDVVSLQIQKMMKMVSYDQNVISEEKKAKQSNEDDVFWKSVSKKKLL